MKCDRSRCQTVRVPHGSISNHHGVSRADAGERDSNAYTLMDVLRHIHYIMMEEPQQCGNTAEATGNLQNPQGF